MKYHIQDHLLKLLNKGMLDKSLKNQFVSRVKQGKLTRDENPTSHICVYFAAHDPTNKQLFMGKHIKSGLWLFNGGHLDKFETIEKALYREMDEEWSIVQKTDIQSPSLFTLTQIENPKKQTCKWHYDIWYFIPLNKKTFHPNELYLAKEFFEWGWKTIDEAKSLTHDEATLKGINRINNLFFN